MALLSYTNDQVISFFYDISQAQMAMGLDALAQKDIDPYPNAHYFYISGNMHTLLGDPTLTQNGVELKTWLTQMMDGDPAWKSVHP
jgi:hypothetical protein